MRLLAQSAGLCRDQRGLHNIGTTTIWQFPEIGALQYRHQNATILMRAPENVLILLGARHIVNALDLSLQLVGFP